MSWMGLSPLVLLMVLLGGCTLTGQLGRPTTAYAPPAADAGALYIYLETMNALGNADPARQATMFHEVEHDFIHAPTTANTLRYALACVTPGHPATHPDEGKRLLETLLAAPEHMTQEERTLAAVALNETNARLKLETENRRLTATLDGQSRSQANFDKRVQAQYDENIRLRRALAEAQQKLDAIKEIERSIIERSSTPSGNRDATTHPDEAQSSSTRR
ncbi:hypothetical protein ACG33_10040 [Steroidobacter denitrificans]|uniref:Uncharacterized protein n=2 Tax=Steroidobacter denitrificans TaxID=465721 RepID=A0A127FCN2_STEDE|nr:hypothetical protein ACG33_10040 [Steroidobacter denitrificans]